MTHTPLRTQIQSTDRSQPDGHEQTRATGDRHRASEAGRYVDDGPDLLYCAEEHRGRAHDVGRAVLPHQQRRLRVQNCRHA